MVATLKIESQCWLYFWIAHLIIVSHVKILTGDDETITAKCVYELMDDSHGVKIKYSHTNNSIYAEKYFTDEVTKSNQTINFYGVVWVPIARIAWLKIILEC